MSFHKELAFWAARALQLIGFCIWARANWTCTSAFGDALFAVESHRSNRQRARTTNMTNSTTCSQKTGLREIIIVSLQVKFYCKMESPLGLSMSWQFTRTQASQHSPVASTSLTPPFTKNTRPQTAPWRRLLSGRGRLGYLSLPMNQTFQSCLSTSAVKSQISNFI